MIDTNEIRYFTLDFSDCKTIMEIYALIRKGLELPDWVGNNPNALWDSLWGIMYTPAVITVKQNFRDPQIYDYIQTLISIMREAEEKYGEITVKVL